MNEDSPIFNQYELKGRLDWQDRAMILVAFLLVAVLLLVLIDKANRIDETIQFLVGISRCVGSGG